MVLSIESLETMVYTVCLIIFFGLLNNNYYNRLFYATNILLYDNWSTQSVGLSTLKSSYMYMVFLRSIHSTLRSKCN